MTNPERPERFETEREKLHEDATIGLIFTVVGTPLAAFLLENTVTIAQQADKYGWHTEGAGVVGNGILTIIVAGLTARHWHKMTSAIEELRGQPRG